MDKAARSTNLAFTSTKLLVIFEMLFWICYVDLCIWELYALIACLLARMRLLLSLGIYIISLINSNKFENRDGVLGFWGFGVLEDGRTWYFAFNIY